MYRCLKDILVVVCSVIFFVSFHLIIYPYLKHLTTNNMNDQASLSFGSLYSIPRKSKISFSYRQAIFLLPFFYLPALSTGTIP